MAKQQQLSVSIQSENKGLVWEGEAKSISSENSQGAFDILPEHANFITIVKNKPISVQTDSEKKNINLDQAVIYVKENKVRIYAI